MQIRGGAGVNLEVNRNNRHKVFASAAFFPERWEDRESFGNGTFQINDRWRVETSYETDTSRPLSVAVKLDYDGQDLYGGSIRTWGGLTWQPRADLALTVGVSYTDIDGWLLQQEGQDFTTFTGTRWQPDLAMDFYPSATQQFRVVLQWVGIRAFEDRFFALQSDPGQLIEGNKPIGPSDDFSISTLNFQVRYRWQIAPLSDLFVVYTKGDARRPDLLGFSDLLQESWQDPLADQLVVKLRYRFGS
ncbi:MAG: DUF5916 domain-containing protein [Woeseiales bacterium]